MTAAFVIGANNVGMDTVEFYNLSDDPAAFSKSREQWGEFSNMCGGFPLIVNDLKVPVQRRVIPSVEISPQSGETDCYRTGY